jgi:XapX domain-containing protein
MGILVGVAYALCQIRSPAPPVVALLGLFGMVIGEASVGAVKQRLFPAPPYVSYAPDKPMAEGQNGSPPGAIR